MISEYKNAKVSVGNALSFTIVVMGVFLSVFVSVREISWFRIATLILIGICYIFIGIYVYSIAAGHSFIWLRFLYIFVEILLALSIIYISNGAGICLLILLPIIGHSVILFAPRVMLGINGLIALLYFGGSRFVLYGSEITTTGLPIYLAGQIFIIIFMQMYIEDEAAHNKIIRLIQELEKANSNLRNYVNQIEELTLVKERNRFAREIHDGLGHYLTVIHMQIQAARAIMVSDPQKALETLTIAQKQSQEALSDVRKSVSAFRELSETRIPLSERINNLVSGITNDKLKITNLMIGKMFPVSPQIELVIFRIIQEGIQNCIKHAHASELVITLDYKDETFLKLIIRDNGIGSQDLDRGFGLNGMEERVKQIGGQIKYQAEESKGFEIKVEIPL
jgi:signal transduction histidine kinase